MRQSTFEALDTWPLLLDAPMAATLACNRIRVGELIAQVQATFQEETGKTLTLAQAIALLDQEIEFSEESSFWEDEPLRKTTIRGIDRDGHRVTVELIVTFDGSTFSMTKYRDGVDVDGYHSAHSLVEVNEQFDMEAEAVREVARERKAARANALPRKARSPRVEAPRPELAAATA